MRIFSRTVPDSTPRLVVLTPPAGAASALDGLATLLAEITPERLLARPAEPVAERRLREAARRLCDEARARDPRAERLLIDLKRSWPTLPAVREIPPYGPRDALWRLLVRVCIEEFYAPPR
jgi:hypothetical protein